MSPFYCVAICIIWLYCPRHSTLHFMSCFAIPALTCITLPVYIQSLDPLYGRHTDSHTHTHAHTHAHIIYVCVYIYIYIYTHRVIHKSLRDFRPLRAVVGMVTPKDSMSTEGETPQVSVLPYRCSICPPLVTRQMSIL